MIAALFVETDGCYFGLPGVDPWDEQRDARKYAGPWPVVAHPPCERWGKMAKVNYVRWGGEHNRPGNDGGCFRFALDAVRTYGGVLEHPAKSYAWATHGLEKPMNTGWQRCSCGGYVCEVWQSAYGHRANKATWLYYFGNHKPQEVQWGRPIGTHQVGFQDQRGKSRNKPSLGRKEAKATPIKFRDALLALAGNAQSPDPPRGQRNPPPQEIKMNKNEKFYGDILKKLEAMRKGHRGPIDEAHFRMWCGLAADEIKKLRRALEHASAQSKTESN